MLESSTTKFCLSACIFIIMINLSMNLVVGLNVFGTMTPSPLLNTTNTSSITTIKGTDIESILTNNLMTVLSTTASTALFLALAVRCYLANDYRILGPALFTLIFWNSWIANISFFATSGYFDAGAMLSIFGMLTIPMIFLFLGAVSGMISGGE